jgi:hypothetical protein
MANTKPGPAVASSTSDRPAGLSSTSIGNCWLSRVSSRSGPTSTCRLSEQSHPRPALPQHTLYRPPVAPTYHQRRTIRRQAQQPNRQTPPSYRQQLFVSSHEKTARSTWMAVSAPSASSSWRSLTLPGRHGGRDLGFRGCRSTTHPFPTRKPSIGPQIFAPMCLAGHPRDRQPALRHDDDTTDLARICG